MKLVIFIGLLATVKSDAVCTLETLREELRQDLAHNRKLDCKRNPAKKTNPSETEEEKKIREDAIWDSDCAFETDYNWLQDLH